MPHYNLVRHIIVSKYDQSGSTPMQAEMLFSQESLIAVFCHRAKQGEKKNRVSVSWNQYKENFDRPRRKMKGESQEQQPEGYLEIPNQKTWIFLDVQPEAETSSKKWEKYNILLSNTFSKASAVSSLTKNWLNSMMGVKLPG